jgi:hypothetical protein
LNYVVDQFSTLVVWNKVLTRLCQYISHLFVLANILGIRFFSKSKGAIWNSFQERMLA